ncbi:MULTISPECIES: chemotaxis protein CheW [unclassified Pseudomonas]|uniref:chemotaxis protein CheW n=1 Tax=unclassified Pseudomonas TaxID=196821 RepID=UPI00119C48DA|nr:MULTISPECIES: chemotaxis protein CheW [unclassified Pseudomonas]TWC18445.1 chemotaxis signal transduction protein [Pseudomonas sp. SJZ075]TWC23449.1 chemotaxis signal transduction protein [Pseudomonas sp. SJZ074]TWC34784.1 chemotaxis signal transduction protein [Pseudomonas sp. SJZ078]TWC40603.1 chemotaxis signal transduction protein [Pseudomonas sp. SJZ085]TWC55470.1 chemotaxis signal transduction protein [Pseudomonas sp. SJZ124]
MTDHDLTLWLCLAMTPGMLMLVALIVYYRGYPRAARQTPMPVEPFAAGGLDELAPLPGNTAEPRGELGTRGNDEVTVMDKDPIGDQSSRAVLQQTLPLATRGMSAAELAEKLLYLADLTEHMLEKSETLSRAAVAPRRVADEVAPNRLYLSFMLGGAAFAVSMSNVHSVIQGARLIGGAGLSGPVRRAIIMDGALVPVVDLGVQVHGQPTLIGERTKIAILEVSVGEHLQRVGVLADGVGAILQIPSIGIDPTARFDSRVGVDFSFATVTVNEQRTTLLVVAPGSSASQSNAVR